MKSLHEMKLVDLVDARIGNDGVITLANALEEKQW
jgi:hypothetical protein